jgi:hypothetical protein
MFFRIKKINGKEYAYKVKNRWTGQGARQKVVGYAGRVYRLGGPPEKTKEISFEDYVSGMKKAYGEYLKEADFDETVMDLIRWEITRHGGEIVDKNRAIVPFGGEKISLELGKETISSNGKEIALKMNDGYLCRATLKSVFGAGLVEEQEAGLDFAQALVSAGLRVPKEVFVKLYEKLS